jgi:hypothetical protein
MMALQGRVYLTIETLGIRGTKLVAYGLLGLKTLVFRLSFYAIFWL